MKYYVVDRSQKLTPGTIIELRNGDDMFLQGTPEELVAEVKKLFPEGVSRFGELHLLRNIDLITYVHSGNNSFPASYHADGLQRDSLIEIIFEFARRAYNPD